MNVDEIYQLIINGKIKVVDQTNGKHYNRCIYCNKVYESCNVYDWFCSEECYNKHKWENRVDMENYLDRKHKKCSLCGREYFYGANKISQHYRNRFPNSHLRNHVCLDCQKIKNINDNTIYLKTCPTCGRTFSHYSKTWKWCSSRCSKEKINHEYIKACQHCGKRFRTRDLNIFYCSEGCAEKYHQGEGLIQKYDDVMTKRYIK